MNRNFAECELKEYVEQPKMIRFKPENNRRPATRSKPQEDTVTHSRNGPGFFYALECEDGLAIVNCIIVVDEASFTGVLFQQSKTTEAENFYQEANSVQTFRSNLVHSQLFSVEKLSNSNITITMNEIEEVLSSMNM